MLSAILNISIRSLSCESGRVKHPKDWDYSSARFSEQGKSWYPYRITRLTILLLRNPDKQVVWATREILVVGFLWSPQPITIFIEFSELGKSLDF